MLCCLEGGLYLSSRSKNVNMLASVSGALSKNLSSCWNYGMSVNQIVYIYMVSNQPYIMVKESATELTGNARYEGYCIDLLDEIAKKLKFKFEIHINEEKKPGKKDNKTGKWNGMIGELMRGRYVQTITIPIPENLTPLFRYVAMSTLSGALTNVFEADLAVGDLTITFEREEAVDFTMPFMNLGISILFKKPTQSVPSLLSFLSPLSWKSSLQSSYLELMKGWRRTDYRKERFSWEKNSHPTLHRKGILSEIERCVSVFLFIIARFSPYEWVSPHPCNQESDVLENQFSLMNSLWFTIGSLMQQGSDLAPTAWSTRMIAATWWFFTLIMISSYTANLAAFLTVQRMVSPIESAEDLARQTKIKYGCYASGSTENFFRNSRTYKRMWDFMESNYETVMVKSGKEGVRRVMEGDYAYLMESTSIEYVTQRSCKITQIGGLLDSKGYGIATPRNSPYRQLISSAILKLQEETVLDVMKEKWWKHKRGGGSCTADDGSKGSTGKALTLANVGGVFVVLLGGIACSWLIGILEFVWKTRTTDSTKKASLCVEILKELKYALSCESSTRQVPKKEEITEKTKEDFKVPNSYPSMQFKEAIS
ncbi:Glutamate receptor ionotropic, kainate 2 [Nymphon striatum]|nr:Glutamate receptor ionotropic, kainate 2 [Nymphon striatum]